MPGPKSVEIDEILKDRNLKENISLFTHKVFTNAASFIDTGIWQGLDKANLDNWISGLREHDETDLLAACLLDNLLYRPKQQFLALIKNMFELCDQDHEINGAPITSLLQSQQSLVWATPVLGIDQPPTKSGPYVLRLAARTYRFHEKQLIWPFDLVNLDKKAKVLLFIDDFCGTGCQFTKFARRNKIEALHKQRPDLKQIYLCAAAHEVGIKTVVDNFPFVTVIASERLTSRNNFFDTEMFTRYRVDGLETYIWDRYKKLVKFHGLPYDGRIKYAGYGQLGLCYGFYHAVPNNTLPVYWASSETWKPLLDR